MTRRARHNAESALSVVRLEVA